MSQAVVTPLPQVVIGASSGRRLSLTKQLANSGEGTVWETDWDGYLAKLYHTPTPDRLEKLKVMVANPPDDPMLRLKNHISFAWPQELLRNQRGEYIGFLMPAIRNSVKLSSIYNPRLRNRKAPRFNWFYLHTTALNVASVIESIHVKGYVVGDIKPQNLLVNDQSLVSVIDTDSFQIYNPKTKAVHRCLVGSEGFTPAELLGTDLSKVDQTEVHDRYRLGVLIYLLLFGDHPFKGKWVGNGEAPSPSELVRSGYWPFGNGSLIQPGPSTIPLQIVHPELQACFRRCFSDGHKQPSARPTAAEWCQALRVAIANLKVCRQQSNHYYNRTYGSCYWCERRQTLGLDVFDMKQVLRARPATPNPASPTTGLWQSSSVALVPLRQTPRPFHIRYRRELGAGAAFGMAMICLVLLIAPDWQNLQSGIARFMGARQPSRPRTALNQSTASQIPAGSDSRTDSKTNTIDLEAQAEHLDGITSLVFSPDGSLLVSASRDASIRLWNLKTGQAVGSLQGHTSPVIALAISADGRQLTTSSIDGETIIWNLQTRQPLRKLAGLMEQRSSDTLHSVAISADGELVASSRWDNVILLRNLRTGNLENSLNQSVITEPLLAITPDGQFLVSSSLDGDLRVWSLNRNGGRLIERFPPDSLATVLTPALALSPSGFLLVNGTQSGQLLLRELASGQRLATLNAHRGRVTTVVINAQGNRLASGGEDGMIKLWSLPDGQLQQTLPSEGGRVLALAFSPDGKTLVSAGEDLSLRVWLLSSGQLQRVIR